MFIPFGLFCWLFVALSGLIGYSSALWRRYPRSSVSNLICTSALCQTVHVSGTSAETQGWDFGFWKYVMLAGVWARSWLSMNGCTKMPGATDFSSAVLCGTVLLQRF